MERLQKRIAQTGVCSRRKAEELIAEGRIGVNGEIITKPGYKVESSDVITMDGSPLLKEPPAYYVLYKPEGCLSTTDDERGRRTVMDYMPKGVRLFPVGRLDYDTSGIMLMTNDGEFMQMMIHPKNHIEKEYEVTVEGFVRKETSKKLCRGIMLDHAKTKPARIYQVTYQKVKETTKLHLIITEGKYHQVKRMFEHENHLVIKLKRIRFGTVTLDGMQKSEVRPLKPHEYKTLMHAAKTKHK